MNQAFFTKLYISDDDTVSSDIAEPFAILLGDGSPTKPRAAGVTASAPGSPRDLARPWHAG